MRRIPPWVDVVSESLSLATPAFRRELLWSLRAKLLSLARTATAHYAEPDRLMAEKAVETLVARLDAEIEQDACSARCESPQFLSEFARCNCGVADIERWLVTSCKELATRLGVSIDAT